MTAACRTAIGHVRKRLYAQRVVWRCEPDNVASRRLAERLGFQREGRARSIAVGDDGRRIDLDVLSLIEAELDDCC